MADVWQIQNRIEDYLGRYECVDGKSNKFWECLKDGDNPGKFATRWGSIKQTKTKHNIKPNMEKWEAAQKISEKTRKGYRFVANSDDVMNLRIAEEEAQLLREGRGDPAVKKGKKAPLVIPEAVEALPPARRRL